ncbi:hypothetical protein MAP00_005112 [Monascus purpureus]|nr:hypothetical protein MAP00_005112 [Monascus purpureus]
MGIHSVTLAGTSSRDGMDESALLHLESLHRLGVAVFVVWEPLSTAHKDRFTLQLRASFVTCRESCCFWQIETILIFTSADDILARPSDNNPWEHTRRAQSNNQNKTRVNGIPSPTTAAIAKFHTIPADDPEQEPARRTTATDAVSETLAELLFIRKEQINIRRT